MSASFDKLKELLEKNEALSDDEIKQVTGEHGDLTDEEQVWIASERHRLSRAKDETITMDQYLEALKVLDSVEEGSDEYNKADAIVTKYEQGG